jgi:hypothetical protein
VGEGVIVGGTALAGVFGIGIEVDVERTVGVTDPQALSTAIRVNRIIVLTNDLNMRLLLCNLCFTGKVE